jgi:hypothetical protein
MRHRSLSTVAIAGLLTLAGCDTTAPTPETFLWKGPIQANGWMRLRNVSGDFEIGETTGDSAEIQFEIKRSSPYAPAAQIKVLQLADGILACALFGDNTTCSATEYKGGSTNRNSPLPFMRGYTTINGRILLPRGVKLDAESVSGDITVTSVGGELKLVTVNGDIEIHGARTGASVTTTNGDVSLGLDALDGPLTVETTNGDVVVDLPASLNASVDLRTTNGELDLRTAGNTTVKTAKQIVASLGTGGSPISIQTTNGDITLRDRRKP